MDLKPYFGYGFLRDRKSIATVIGRDPGEGRSGVIQGYKLAYQNLDQVPEKIRPILEKSWGGEFKAYTLRKGQGIVAGTIWMLTDEDIKKIHIWEFVGGWRNSESGVATSNTGEQVNVMVTKVPDDQPVKEFVDGILYETRINQEGKRIYDQIISEHETETLSHIRLQLMELSGKSTYGTQ
jgi:hypothetical protein